MGLEPGTRLADRYVVRRPLGRGGSATAYAVEDRLRGGERALKLLDRQGAPGLDAFRDEFAQLRRLAIVGLAAVHDFGFARLGEELVPFYTAEIIDGPPLDELATRGWEPVQRALIDSLGALAALHRLGLRHGDVKPANILVRADGHGVLIDLGCARPLGSPAEPTVSGTARYLAPELRRGEPADARADLYAVGVMLEELSRTCRVPARMRRIGSRLRAPDPSARPSDVREVLEALGADAVTPAPAGGAAVRLVGRERELRRFETMIDTLASGAPETRALLLVGPSGIGRSRLLDEMRWRSQLRARTLEAAPERPRALRRLLVQAAGTPDLPEGVAAAAEARRRVVERGEPTVVVVDDCQWLSGPEQALLATLLGTLERHDPLVVLCSRPAALEVAGPAIETWNIGPLREEDVARWVDAPLAASELRSLVERTGGVPSYVEGAVARLREGRPDTLANPDKPRHSGGTGTHGLGRDAGYALAVLAVLDGPLDEAMAERLDVTRAALDELVRTGWCRLEDTGARLARTADAPDILAGFDGGTVRTLELRIADALGERAGAEPGDDAWVSGLRARQVALLVRAGEMERAREQLRLDRSLAVRQPTVWAAVGEELLRGSAEPDDRLEAAALLERGGRSDRALGALAATLRERPGAATRARIHLQAGRCYVRLGRPGRAVQELRAALARSTDPTLCARAHDGLSRALRQRGAYPEALEAAREGLEHAIDPRDRAALEEDLGIAATFVGDHATATAHLAEARRLHEDSGDARALYRVLAYRAIGSFRGGDLGAAQDAFREALDLAERNAMTDLLPNAALNLATVYHQRGDLGPAATEYERGLHFARVQGKRATTLTLRYNLANLYAESGQLDRACEWLGETLEEAEQAGLGHVVGAAALVQAEVALARGDLESAHALVERAASRFEQGEALRERAEVALVRAALALAREDGHGAEETLHAARTCIDRAEARDLRVRHALLASRALVQRSDTAGALLVLEQALATAESGGYRLLVGEAHAALADVCERRSALELASSHRTRAREALERVAATLPVPERDAFWAHPRRRDLSRTPTLRPPQPSEARPAALRRFLEVNRRINAASRLDDVLVHAMDAAIELTGAERGFVLLRRRGEARGRLEVPVARNLDRERIAHTHLKFSRGIADQVVESGEPVLTTDAFADSRFREHESVHAMGLRSVACVPVVSPEGTLGALYLDNRFQSGLFSDADVQLLVVFAEQVAIAIGNVRLREDLERRSRELEQRTRELAAEKHRVEELLEGREEEIDRLQEEVRLRQDALELRHDKGRIVGRSPAMQRLFATLMRVADTPATVLVRGESGTGKELVARALHYHSRRRDRPFVAVNCAAIPDALLESELFGHVRGAFTGADADKVGLLVSARGGTVLLDEVGEMPASMQAKLLRVLQEREVRPVGASSSVALEARVVAATHRDLTAEVAAGRFREDLYYRLAVVELFVPPLRERVEDIPALAQHTVGRLAEEAGTRPPTLARNVLPALCRHPWPGNVRQLENVLTRAYVMCRGHRLTAADLELPQVGAAAAPDRATFERQEAERILAALHANRWNVRAVSRQLGIPSNTLYRKLKRYGLQRP